MNEELKRCPFCGGKAQRVEDLIRRFEFPFFVRCADCEAQTKSYARMEDAVKAWNTRESENV